MCGKSKSQPAPPPPPQEVRVTGGDVMHAKNASGVKQQQVLASTAQPTPTFGSELGNR